MQIIPDDFDMSKYIDKVDYYILSETITVCIIIDVYGFRHKGESFCANKKDFNKELGEQYALKLATDSMFPYYTFLQKYIDSKNMVDSEHRYSIKVAMKWLSTGDYHIKLEHWNDGDYLFIDEYVIFRFRNKQKIVWNPSISEIVSGNWKLIEAVKEKPVKIMNKNIGDAIKGALSGKYKISLDDSYWITNGMYVILNDGVLYLKNSNGYNQEWNPSANELISRNWIIEKIIKQGDL